jgi:hypothetical protein
LPQSFNLCIVQQATAASQDDEYDVEFEERLKALLGTNESLLKQQGMGLRFPGLLSSKV